MQPVMFVLSLTVFSALLTVGLAGDRPRSSFCNTENDGNYACYEGQDVKFCSCYNRYHCPNSQWYDPLAYRCVWNTEFALRLVDCIQQGSGHSSRHYEPTETVKRRSCWNVADGNYVVDYYPFSEVRVLSCYRSKVCPGKAYYDVYTKSCASVTFGWAKKIISCIKKSKKPAVPSPTPGVCGVSCKAYFERKSYVDETLRDLVKDVEHLHKYIDSKPHPPRPGKPHPPRPECPHGFKSLHDRHVCYKVVTVPMTWYQGQTYCASLDRRAHLAHITSRQQNDALTDHLLDYKGTSRCYIAGARHEIFFTSGQRVKVGDCRSNFHWKLDDWTTIPMTYRNWKSGEPNCYGNLKESCVNIRCIGRRCEWNDYSCDLKSCLVCQVNLR